MTLTPVGRSQWFALSWSMVLLAATCGSFSGFVGVGGGSGFGQRQVCAETPDPDQLAPVEGLDQDILPRQGLRHSGPKFQREKTGLVAYLGGSITHNPGWTQMVDAELQRRFPETRFTFVHAGIPSIDSSGHAFRFTKDILEKGIPDLLFVEAAVNDLHNGRTSVEQLRGMEGVIRNARRANRNMDIVMLHFAEPRYSEDYAAGRVPDIIATHERVAEHYGVASIHLAREVQRRLKAGQFDWKRDFRDLHPSPFGQRLYFLAVKRLFDACWSSDVATTTRANSTSPAENSTTGGDLPPPLDRFSYDLGEMRSPARSVERRRFVEVPAWKPMDKAGTRAGFVDVPLWVAEGKDAGFTIRFEGRGIGFFLVAGPDTGVIEYRVDKGPWKRRDSFTQWSRQLYLPWVLMLETELESGPHELDVRLAEVPNEKASGNALRIRDILINGPAHDVPQLTELSATSSLDGTTQPSRFWAPDRATREDTPVLIYLHSWSGDYRQDNAPWLHQAASREWIYLHPNFRGVNRRPEACGSRLARQDILDALDVIQARYKVDRSRIYLAGTSGGGHMALLMAAYHPDRFSAVSAWVGISDLADWHDFHVRGGKPDHYAQMTRDALGGAPGSTPEVDAQYRERSPRFHLGRAGDLPIDIAAGVKDGKTGSVPIRHSLWAFNVIAATRGASTVPEHEIEHLWNEGRLASPGPNDEVEDPSYGRAILLRRMAGSSRVTIFDGGHEGLAPAGCAWLALQTRPTKE